MLGDEHLEHPVEALAGHRQRLGAAAGFDFPVHPHTLRQACGYKLANDGVDTRSLQAYLGHKNIQHTTQVVYCLERVPAVVCGATASLWDCSSNFRYPSIRLQTFRCVTLSDATGQHRALASRRSSCVAAFSFVGSHYCTVEDADRTAL
jgi:Phage integrase family